MIDVIIISIGVALTVLPVLKENYRSNNYQIFIGKTYVPIIILLGVILITTSILKNFDDNKQKDIYVAKIDSLNSMQKKVVSALDEERSNRKKFENELTKKFSIIRDQKTNLPKLAQNIYISNFNRVGNVKIGTNEK